MTTKNIDKKNISRSADLLKSLGSHTRLAILCQLCAGGEMNVTELCNNLGIEQSSTSHQLARLRREHLVTTVRRGSEVYYKLADNSHAKLAQNLISKCGCLKDK